jgi:hypothetical protein
VAIIFHAHCLNPFRFYTDLNHRARARISNLWEQDLAFPLQRLHDLISNDTWTDAQSAAIWESTYNIPYQVWNEDPANGGTLKLQNVAFLCPWCNNTSIIPLDKFAQTHILKSAASTCGVCAIKFDADKLSAWYLAIDLSAFREVRDAWY